MDKAAREAVARRALERSSADETEAIVAASDDGLTRFTRNAIHQNVASSDAIVRVRVMLDQRTGVASTNDLSDASLEKALARACDLARHSPQDPEMPPMSAAAPVDAPAHAFVEATAAATAGDRAALAREIFDVAEEHGLWAAGFVTTSCKGVTIANSRGALQSFDGTHCGLALKQNGYDSTGYAERFSTDVAELDATASATVAARKAAASVAPVDVEPGDWTVILEPPAAGELLDFLASHFSAQSYDEGSSFLSGRLGERFAGENVTIVDDVRDPHNPSMPFDFEGTPTQRVALLDHGVATGIVTDAKWAAKLGRPNTGHAFPAPNAYGPAPSHLVVQPGTKSLDELVAQTKRGLLVSRLWYVRTVDQRKTIVTGMTRDGTFLIEDGVVGRGVRNLRFNQSILEALQAAEFGRDLALGSSYSYGIVLPAVKFERFTFSSGTEF